MQAKREISRLWDDIAVAPYKTLFNPSTFGPNVWTVVRMQRVVDQTLQEELRKLVGRERLIAVHGNRLIAWLVKRELPGGAPTDEQVKESAQNNLRLAIEAVNDIYPDSYPASLFKNLSKCKQLAAHIQK